MNQSRSIAIPLIDHNEIMAGAIHHLRNAMETGSRRSCAVACMLFTCLAQDDSLGTELCEECRGLGECLEGLTEYASWANHCEDGQRKKCRNLRLYNQPATPMDQPAKPSIGSPS